MNPFISAALFLAFVIHLPPILGVLGQAQLSKLYGIDLKGTELLVLMQHRAVLFAIIAGVLLWSATRPEYYSIGLIVGVVSTISFLLLAMTSLPLNAQLMKIIWADVIALVGLLLASALYWLR